MHFDEFAKGNSFLHSLDPRVKIICGGLFSIAVAVSRDINILLVSLLIAALLVRWARIDRKKLLSRFLVVNGFILFLWFVLPPSVPGEKLFGFGPLSITREGVLLSLTITLRANAIYGALLALLGTSSVIKLVHGLHHLRVPGKLVQLFFFTFRYLSVIHDEYERSVRALKVRCFRPRTNRHTYRTYAYVVGMLFLKSYERSQRIYSAMLCRGFRGEFRTLDHFSFERRDVLFLTAGLIMVSLLILWQVVGI